MNRCYAWCPFFDSLVLLHDLLVTDRRSADVHLAAVDVHAIGVPVDDVDVEVRIVLLAGAPLAVPLGVGDALRASAGRSCGRSRVLVDGLAVTGFSLASSGAAA